MTTDADDARLGVLRRADQAVQPWRNGGGVTREIAHDAAPGDEPWVWRVSVAEVSAAGPFSSFPGVDREILLVDGPRMVLDVDGQRHTLRPHDRLRFAGEATTSCLVPDGPTRDLNVMTQRGLARAELSVVALTDASGSALPPGALAVVLDGNATVVDGSRRAELQPLDALRPASGERELSGRGHLAVVTISPGGPRQGS